MPSYSGLCPSYDFKANNNSSKNLMLHNLTLHFWTMQLERLILTSRPTRHAWCVLWHNLQHIHCLTKMCFPLGQRICPEFWLTHFQPCSIGAEESEIHTVLCWIFQKWRSCCRGWMASHSPSPSSLRWYSVRRSCFHKDRCYRKVCCWCGWCTCQRPHDGQRTRPDFVAEINPGTLRIKQK